MKSLLLLVLVAVIVADVIEGNFMIQLDNVTDNTFDLKVYTRSRFGRSILTIYNNDPQVGVPFATNNRGGKWRVEIMKPKATLYSEDFDYVQDGLTINVTDPNQYPVGNYGSDVITEIRFDRKVFQGRFGNTFNISVISMGKQTFDAVWPVVYSIVKQMSIVNNTVLEIPKTNISRYEHLSLTFFLITLTWYLISFLLCIIFWGNQPLKSRGLIPYLAIFCFTVSLCYSGSAFIFDFTALTTTACIWKAFIEYPIMLSCIFVSVANFLRYVVLINMNKYKQLQLKLKNHDEDENKPPVVAPGKLIMLFKIMSHWAFTLSLIIFLYVVSTAFFGLALVIMKFKCESRDFLYYFNAYVYIGVALMALPIVLFDLWMNRDIICSCSWWHFWKEDVFWTRFEIYVLTYGFALGVYCIVRIMSLVGVSPFGRLILFSIAYHGLYFAIVVFPLLITIINWIRRKLSAPPAQNVMLNILNHSEGYFLVLEFARNEYSAENVACWDDIQKYKAEPDNNRKRKIAMSIYATYMMQTSPSEINLPVGTLKAVKDKLDTGIPTKSLFNECENQLLANISDTFSRFCITREYYGFAQRERFIMNSLGNQ